jgi:hypothetical protein
MHLRFARGEPRPFGAATVKLALLVLSEGHVWRPVRQFKLAVGKNALFLRVASKAPLRGQPRVYQIAIGTSGVPTDRVFEIHS